MRTIAIPALSAADVERFWSYVDKAGDCWQWTAGTNNYGYGRFGLNGKRYLAHRVAHQIANGTIAEGLVVDHICLNRRCVRPAHLHAVTIKQNLERRAGAAADSKSGVRGVYFQDGSWVAEVRSNGRLAYRERFSCIDAAALAVASARQRIFTNIEELAA
ncbi:HNH endonuclease [Cellulosimicrobium cellulans]|uniref:HNH endonuclease signature motif containing protein n=1 Tax=Cellulosimicrobium cellulans TaxID=1710 RepID=UPI0019639532|nr:HNH endonuclease signature motif containing protein [Cellulosimicrobium cellulans]MBN0040227.1 HNH endonuclease [Cellulosimicrobium cellulans]